MNIKTMDDDLFKRICRKQCIPVSDDEIEIFGDESMGGFEEEEIPLELTEEPFDLNAWSKELECMKRRIQLLQLKLKQKLAECPEETCVDLEVELNCSENKEICQLQKNHSKLQYQINELTRCMKFAKDQIKDLRTRMCEKSKDIEQLQKIVARLESWRKTLDHEFGLCLERFNYLKHAKAEWRDVLYEMQKYQSCCHKMEQMFVPQACYKRDKIEFTKEADTLRDMFKNLCLIQMERFGDIEQRISQLEEHLAKQEEPKPKVEENPTNQEEEVYAELLIKAERMQTTETVPLKKIYIGLKDLLPKIC